MKEKNYKVKIFDKNMLSADLGFAFTISALATFLFLFCTSAQFEGRNTWVTGDVIIQYIPAIRSFFRNLLSGNGITYSWDLYMGMNATELYSTYVGWSFTNLIYLLFPNIDPEVFFYIMLTLKGGMMGLSFTYFGKKVIGVEGRIATFFGIFYTLCAFQVTFGTVHYVWVDSLYMLPLILTFIVDFIEEKRWKRLVFSYAYLFLCHFYMGYIVGFFSALFFLIYVLLKNNTLKNQMKDIVFYGILVILAAGLVAFSVLPIAEFILTKNPLDATEVTSEFVERDILVLLSRFAFGITWEQYTMLPYFYCGIPVLLLVPYFFVNQLISRKDKIFYGVLSFLMVISCMVLPLYMFWHGFDSPDMWYYRFSFLVSFLWIVMACIAVKNMAGISPKQFALISSLEIVFGVGICLYCEIRRGLNYSHLLWKNILLAISWIVFLGIFIWCKEELKKKILYLFLCGAVLETVWNGVLQIQVYTPKEEIEIWSQESSEAVTLLSQDQAFYRVNYENDFIDNSDTYWGYKGISDFWSYENYETRSLLNKLGGYGFARVSYSYGLNPFTQMLLDVKYNIHGSASTTWENSGANIQQFSRVLNLGFMVPEELKTLTLDNENVYENCNRLASALIGDNIELFTKVPEEKVLILEDGIIHGSQDGYQYLYGNPDNSEMNKVDFMIPYEGKEAYITFQGYNNNVLAADSPRIFNYYNTRDIGMFGSRYSKKMDLLDDYLVCTVAMQNGITRNQGIYESLQCYYASEEALDYFYQIAGENQLEIEEYKNGFVRGSVKVTANQKLLFTSIPYDKDWKVNVVSENGEKDKVRVVPLLENAFLGIEFPEEGEYTIELSYFPSSLRVGMVISVVFFVIMLLLLVFNQKNEKTSKENGMDR